MYEVVKYRTKPSYFSGKCTNSSSYLCELFCDKRPHPNPPPPPPPFLYSYWHKLERTKQEERRARKETTKQTNKQNNQNKPKEQTDIPRANKYKQNNYFKKATTTTTTTQNDMF